MGCKHGQRDRDRPCKVCKRPAVIVCRGNVVPRAHTLLETHTFVETQTSDTSKLWRQAGQWGGLRRQKQTDRYGWVSYCWRALCWVCRWDSEEPKPTTVGDFRVGSFEENVKYDSFPRTKTHTNIHTSDNHECYCCLWGLTGFFCCQQTHTQTITPSARIVFEVYLILSGSTTLHTHIQ